MKNKKNTIKTIFGCTAACSALMLSGAGLMNLNTEKYEVQAIGVDSIPVSITNSNFNNNTSSSYPFNPNSYNAYNGNTKVNTSNSNIDENIKMGVINLTSEKYESRFSLANRTSLDNYVLMIDSTNEEDGTAHNANYGYRTNSSIKLEANSKYMFSVDVFTATDANIANLYLYDKDGEEFAKIENINSHNNWTTHTFFVATNNTESIDLTIGMYLNGAGTVLFDNICGFKLSDNEYDFSKTSFNHYVEKDLNDSVIKSYKINKDGQIQNKEDSSDVHSLSNVEFDSNSIMMPDTNSDGENTYAIKIENSEKTYSQFETDEILSFAPNRLYKVSVNVKTKNLDGTASLQLIRTDIAEDDDDYDANKNKTIKITSSTYSASTNSVTNDYKTYSFYINAHSEKTLKFKLKFGLGLEDARTSGEMYVSEIEVSKIDYNTFDSASDNEKINFVDVYSNSKIMLNNGDFNGFKIEDYNAPIPATPIDWTVSTGKNIQKYGVVNTKTFTEDFNGLNLSKLRNPSEDENNNVLMMYNESTDTLSYTSSSKKLTSLSYHKFEIDVQTQNAPLTISLVTKKDNQELVVASKTVNTYYSWETIALYIHAGHTDLDVSLKLTLNSDAYGYAYVDNAKFDYILTANELEEAFNSASNSNTSVVVDLTNPLESASGEKYAQTFAFNNPAMTGVESGTITFKKSYLDEVIDYNHSESNNNLDKFNKIAENETDKKAIAIWSTDEVAYKMTSNVGFSLVSGDDKYYKFSVDVFTQNIDSNNSETDKNLIGAGFGLSGYENAFTNIRSNNVWTTYSFYVKVDSSKTTYLELSLGTENAKTKGSVFFTNFNFENINKTEYENVSENNLIKILKPVEKAQDPETDTTVNETKESSNINWLYLIPGLLTALAILIAIVGFIVRKVKFKNPFKKKSKTTYDRNRTLSVQYYARKATTMREEKVRELNADWKKINEERKQFEENYKKDLTKLREMKIKRANPQEIAKLEKELKKNQKISANLGLTANKIIDELKYVSTDLYLNSLMKKLAREQATISENNENEENK